jgi:hypothetical protein
MAILHDHSKGWLRNGVSMMLDMFAGLDVQD